MMATCPFPIAILSFNRPDLLTEVLKSLKSQTVGVDGACIYLFQDGAQSRFTQEPADDFLQNECVKCGPQMGICSDATPMVSTALNRRWLFIDRARK
jgi:hypothetical protein